MRLALLLAILAGALVGLTRDNAAVPTAKKPYGIASRIPWTTSRIVGSPEPPPPYRVRRVYPELKAPHPIAVAHEPGTEQFLLVHQLWPWVGPGRILRVPENGTGATVEVLLALDRTIYGL